MPTFVSNHGAALYSSHTVENEALPTMIIIRSSGNLELQPSDMGSSLKVASHSWDCYQDDQVSVEADGPNRPSTKSADKMPLENSRDQDVNSCTDEFLNN